MEGVDVPAIAAGAGPWFLAATIIVALVRGELVPRKTHDAIVGKRDETIRELTTDRDFYRDHTLQLLRVADTAAKTQELLSHSASQRERGDP